MWPLKVVSDFEHVAGQSDERPRSSFGCSLWERQKQNNSVTSAMQKKVDQASVPSISSSPNVNSTVFESMHMFVAKKF